MLDMLEQMETCAEKTLDEMTSGLPEGKFRCDCGNLSDLDSAISAAPSPYSPPICADCAERAFGD